MRATRLISIVLLLQNRGRMSASALAADLEVSVRTVHRDIEALAEAGIPVLADRGALGGFRLIDGYRTRLTGLTGDEAAALFLAALPGPASDLGLGEVAEDAYQKVLAALSAEQRAKADRLNQVFLLDPDQWFTEPDELVHLALLGNAVWRRQVIRIGYQRGWDAARTVVERELEPLGLVLKGGTWYLIAAPGGQARMYRVSRIKLLELLDRTFEPAEDFDLRATWRACAAAFERGIYRQEVAVRISQSGLARMPAFLSPYQVAAVRRQVPEGTGDGGVAVLLPVQSIDHAHWDVMKMAPEMRVDLPSELVANVAATARAMMTMHVEGS